MVGEKRVMLVASPYRSLSSFSDWHTCTVLVLKGYYSDTEYDFGLETTTLSL